MRPAAEPLRSATGRNTLAARLQHAWTGRGALARALWPLSLLLRLSVSGRRQLYTLKLLRSQRLPVPVVVVGNLLVGGAGKTPTVVALVALLRSQGHRPGIVSRGYGRAQNGVCAVTPETPVATAGDEPLLLRLRTGAPVWVGRDRAAAARGLLAAHPDTTVIVSDDGLQHLALARDLQLVVFDERGLGNGWLLPAGPLREPLPAPGAWPGRVPTRVLYNAAAATTALPGTLLRGRLSGAVSLADWWAGHKATAAALAALREPPRPLLAAAGTARPQRFFAMLRAQGLRITELPLPDHHAYLRLPWPPSTEDVLVTEKDAIKLAPQRLAGTRVWVLPLDFEFDPVLADDLRQLLPVPARP